MEPPSPEPALPAIPGVSGLVVIGRGGFGTVYRGHQEDFARDVAVKVLTAAASTDGAAMEAWRREVTAMGRLSNHPNIVPVYTAGITDEGHPYLVMPYMAGGSLHDRLNAQGPIEPAALATLAIKLAGGLGAAHDAGVLHRDVKPANVLLSEYDEPQLSDFGISRLIDTTNTMTGTVQATIGYASPEVLSGERSTVASDIYSLGATLHAAARAEAPFEAVPGEPILSRVGRVLTQPPPPLVEVGVPAALAAVIEACMAKEPAGRPASASELRERLEAAVAGRTTPPRPVDGPESTTVMSPVTAAAARDDRPDSNAAPAIIAILLALLLLGGLGGYLLTRDGGSGTAAGPTSESTTSSSSTTEATTSSTSTTSTTTTSTSTTTTTTAPPLPPLTNEELAQATQRYYEVIGAGDLDTSWSLLSPGFQERSGGFDEYRRWWSETVAQISVLSPPVGAADTSTATVQLRYELADGRVKVDELSLRFLRQPDGQLLIDGEAVMGSVEPDEDADGDPPEAPDDNGSENTEPDESGPDGSDPENAPVER